MQSEKALLALVLPCYNEQAVLPDSLKQLDASINHWIELGLIHPDSFACFVDDGSSDTTWQLIKESHFSWVRGLKLAANRGHQLALLAGLEYVTDRCDACVSLDADLQHDINAIPQMLERYRNGDHIVFGVRETRGGGGRFKAASGAGFYKMMSRMGIKLIPQHADFRLMSKAALQALAAHPERNVFLRGLIPQLGFQSSILRYRELARTAGESKYTLKHMLSLAWAGVSACSSRPLRWVTMAGALIFCISLLCGLYAFIAWATSNTIPGWASIVLPMYFLGGCQLLGIGIVGEYLARVYDEVKQRPRYWVEEVTIRPTSKPTPEVSEIDSMLSEAEK